MRSCWGLKRKRQTLTNILAINRRYNSWLCYLQKVNVRFSFCNGKVKCEFGKGIVFRRLPIWIKEIQLLAFKCLLICVSMYFNSCSVCYCYIYFVDKHFADTLSTPLLWRHSVKNNDMTMWRHISKIVTIHVIHSRCLSCLLSLFPSNLHFATYIC